MFFINIKNRISQHRQFSFINLNFFFFIKVTLSVDDQYKERWTSPGTFNMLASSQVYVGGAPRDLQVRSHKKGAFIYQKMELPVNYMGCLRKVRWYLL